MAPLLILFQVAQGKTKPSTHNPVSFKFKGSSSGQQSTNHNGERSDARRSMKVMVSYQVSDDSNLEPIQDPRRIHGDPLFSTESVPLEHNYSDRDLKVSQ